MFFEIESLGFAFSRMLTINLSTPPHLLSDVANMLVLFIDAHFNCFCLCEHGIYYLVEVLRIPLGIGSKAPSVKCVFFL